jgi:TetR/AcrR family fatty acid metabolism transcriptional regulator
MRSARSLNVGDKREAILRAATSVFAHNGYFNSKVADIAREAGVADGTVYLYFKSKEDILHSISSDSAPIAISQSFSRLSCAAQRSLWKSFRRPALQSISR